MNQDPFRRNFREKTAGENTYSDDCDITGKMQAGRIITGKKEDFDDYGIRGFKNWGVTSQFIKIAPGMCNFFTSFTFRSMFH